jgi:hypothetical protein
MPRPHEKQRRHRERLRASGLRPLQIWVPDTRAPGFAAECRRQVERVNAMADTERETLDFIDAAAAWPDEGDQTQ